MRELPRGTVTFLFTDIEGSTRLLRRLGDEYADLLRDYQATVRRVVEAKGGREIDTQGDSFFVAFSRAKDAVQAAVDAQHALAVGRWPQGATLRVRMGLHTGEPLVGEDRYVGLGVHKAARIGAAAQGGQILVSNATRELVEDELPAGMRLLDLGEHKLKDIDRSERLFQVTARGLRSHFSPIRAEATAARPRLLRSLTPRRRALAAGAALAAAGAIAALALALTGADAGKTPSVVTGDRTTSPGKDPHTIVPGESIGAIELGMSEAELKARYGEGVETHWLSRGRNGKRFVYSGPGGALSAALYNGKVVQIETTSSYYATDNGIRVGSLLPDFEAFRPGVDTWREFVFEAHQSWCLRGENAATQLVQGPVSRHIASIFVTEEPFLPYLPARVDPNPYTGGEEFYCAPEPIAP